MYLPGLDAVRRVRRVAVGVAARLNALGDPLPPSVERLGRAEVLRWQNNGLRFLALNFRLLGFQGSVEAVIYRVTHQVV